VKAAIVAATPTEAFMYKSCSTAALLSLLLAGSPAFADPTAARPQVSPIATRQLPPGITPGEAARLRHEAQELQMLKRQAHADGTVTRREQAAINHEAAQLRRMVHKAKTN
jgi:hypothetical protein